MRTGKLLIAEITKTIKTINQHWINDTTGCEFTTGFLFILVTKRWRVS